MLIFNQVPNRFMAMEEMLEKNIYSSKYVILPLWKSQGSRKKRKEKETLT